MNELYWLTRLNGINVLLGTLMFLSIIGFVIFIGGFLVCNCKVGNNFTKNHFKCLIAFSILTTFFSLTFILTPTKQDMFMIYGVGGAIDYIKSNDTAKQLPDKCIDALDKFIDEYVNEANNEKENKEE